MHEFVEVALEPARITRDALPSDVEVVIAVVVPLRVGGMRAPRLDHHGAHDHGRNDRPVRIGADDLLIHELLGDDDHTLRREGRFLLHAHEAPHLRIPRRVGALRVNDRDARVQRGDGGQGFPRVRTRHRLDARIRLCQVGAHVIAQRPEREAGRARGEARDHPEMRVLLDLEPALGRPPFDGAPERVQRADAGVPGPREDQLPRAARRDHLVVDQIGREAGQGQVAAPLADDLVTRGKADEVGEAFDDDGVTVVDETRDRVAHRRHFGSVVRHPWSVIRRDCSCRHMVMYLRMTDNRRRMTPNPSSRAGIHR